MKILITDDDQSYAKLNKAILDDAGHTSVIAMDGMEAIQLASNTPFDIGIIDIFMPHKHGIEAIRDLKITAGHEAICHFRVTCKIVKICPRPAKFPFRFLKSDSLLG